MSSTNRKVSVSRGLRGFPQLLCRDVPARERRHRIKGCKHRQKLPWWLCDNLSAMQETQVQFLGQEDPLEEGTATHSYRQRSLEDYIPQGCTASNMAEANKHASTHVNTGEVLMFGSGTSRKLKNIFFMMEG